MQKAIPRRLDKSRGDAGQVFPPMPHPSEAGAVAHFEQDGFFFDHEGKLVEAFLTPEQRASLAKPDKAKSAKAADADAGEAADNGEEKKETKPKTRRDKRVDQLPEAKITGSDKLNLVAWLTGEEKYPEFRVKKVVRDRYSRVFANMADMVTFLVIDEKLVEPRQVKDEFKVLFGPSEQA